MLDLIWEQWGSMAVIGYFLLLGVSTMSNDVSFLVLSLIIAALTVFLISLPFPLNCSYLKLP